TVIASGFFLTPTVRTVCEAISWPARGLLRRTLALACKCQGRTLLAEGLLGNDSPFGCGWKPRYGIFARD
ncbi:MAG: hypothetical protein Q7U34_15750, partial [Anaerolineales bacterium]|nr:hypothetical protein [Anaerolineales bacterium]